MKRRTFLAMSAQAALLATTASAAPAVRRVSQGFLAQTDQALLAGVLEILLPPGEDGSPGASDLHATEYLLDVLGDPEIDPSDKSTVREGLTALDRFAKKNRGKKFLALPDDEQEAVLQEFVDEGDGESFVSVLLSYVIESLFGDPVYGINPDEVGWKWINHHPGFPRPPRPKWYRPKIA